MEFTAGDIAALLKGEVSGDKEVKISDISKIEEGKPGTLTFLANPIYEDHIYTTAASAALVNKDFVPERPLPAGLTLIKVEDAYGSLAVLLAAYNKSKQDISGISERAYVDPGAKVGKDVYVGPNATVGPGCAIGDGVKIHANAVIQDDCVIGDRTVIHSNVSIYHSTEIGQDCILHSGVIIGGDGFGFAPRSSGYNKVPQIGKVIIENHVEIGAGTCIDRATIGATVIKEGVKLDNLIQIAHNVVIGENTVIAAQTGIAGSTKIGKNCMIGGQVGIIGHITIADEVKIAAQSGIGHSIEEVGAIVQGSPAIPNREFKRAYVHFVKLPELRDKVIALERTMKELKPNYER